MIEIVDRRKIEWQLEYDDAGRLVRVDVSTGITVVHLDYVAPKGRPIPVTAYKGSDLEMGSWEGEPHVQFDWLKNVGARVWGDNTMEARERPSGTITRAHLPDFFTIILDGKQLGGETPDPKQNEFVKAVAPVRGNRADKVVVYFDAAGRRIERFADDSVRRYDARGRLISSLDSGRAAMEYLWDEGSKLLAVKNARFELSRDPKTGAAVKVVIADGKKQAPVPVTDFRIDGADDLVIEHSTKKEPGVFFEIVRAAAAAASKSVPIRRSRASTTAIA